MSRKTVKPRRFFRASNLRSKTAQRGNPKPIFIDDLSFILETTEPSLILDLLEPFGDGSSPRS